MVAVTPHREDFPRFRISAERWRRMIATGIIGEDDRVELLEGEIHAMPPQGEPHVHVISHLGRLLNRILSEDYIVRTQGPLATGGHSVPEPDLAVVESSKVKGDRPPGHALLVIEAANTSLPIDRVLKLRLYARSGVPEYWIVNLLERQIEVHREPVRKAGLYRLREVFTENEIVRSRVLPKVRVPVKSLFR